MQPVTHINKTAQRWNAQNVSISQRLSTANKCVDQLIQDHYTVLSVDVENGQPLICIYPSQRAADELHGHLHIRKGGGSTQHTYTASYMDCTVQWEKEGGYLA